MQKETKSEVLERRNSPQCYPAFSACGRPAIFLLYSCYFILSASCTDFVTILVSANSARAFGMTMR